MLVRIHVLSSAIALLTIAIFWFASAVVEIGGNAEAILSTKTAIVYGLMALVPAMVIVGLTGNRLAGKSTAKIILNKKRRLKIAAINGLVLLVPSAILLWTLAAAGQYSGGFAVIQAIEFIAGAANIVLLGLNMRDGLQMTGKLKKRHLRNA